MARIGGILIIPKRSDDLHLKAEGRLHQLFVTFHITEIKHFPG